MDHEHRYGDENAVKCGTHRARLTSRVVYEECIVQTAADRPTYVKDGAAVDGEMVVEEGDVR